MITIKSQREVDLMREAGRITADMLLYVASFIKPGISTYELDMIAANYLEEHEVISAFKGYHDFPSFLCISVNEEVIHGIAKKSRILEEGDLVTLDGGCIYKSYYADHAWTFPVGKINEKLTQLIDVTKQALQAGIAAAVPGAKIGDIGFAISEVIKPYKYGIVEEFTGHGLGRSLHEDPQIPNYGKPNTGITLKEGMVICIEPMINLGSKKVKVLQDNWTAVTIDKMPSVHFEHMIAITKEGNEILTLPSKIKTDKE